jgi:hypothetical protein
MPVTSAASNTAVPEAVSQPKKQLPNFIPPKDVLLPTHDVASVGYGCGVVCGSGRWGVACGSRRWGVALR